MGRIAYLSKRGNIWWFRRRYPAIVISVPQNAQVSGTCGTLGRKAQAKGHLAVSLQTSSSREARLLGARLSAHFEAAWWLVEADVSSRQDQEDILDNMASMITETFRKFIEHYRATGVAGMAPALRERAFARLDAELRAALGIAPLPYSEMLNRVEIRPAIKYIALHDPDPTAPLSAEDELLERLAGEATHEGSIEWQHAQSEAILARALKPVDFNLIDADDERTVPRLEEVADGIGRLVDEYINSCEKMGIDPKEQIPAASQIAKTLNRAARQLGFSAGQAESSLDNAKSEPVLSVEPFTKFAERYLDLRSKGYSLRREDEAPLVQTGISFIRSSLRNWQSSVRVFSEIVGDLSLSKVGKEEVIEFNTMIQRLPANFGRSSKDTRSARQVIEDLDEQEPVRVAALADKLRKEGKPPGEIEDALAKAATLRLSATTIKRHQTALQSIFGYALTLRLIDKNPFKGMLLTEAEVKRWKRSAARIERTGWGDAIYDLLSSEIYTTPLEDIGDPRFWIPLISMYTGLRLEEICQLRVRDFGKAEGIQYLAVQNEIGSQLNKSDNALRRIPLHRALIDVGLPKLVELRKQSGMSRLFPDMPRSKSKGTLSAIMSKRFGYYTKSRGVKDVGLDFHALRTEFHVRLARAKVPEHVRKGYLGHEQNDVTYANYFRIGETMESLKDYIDLIDIDHRGILPPFGAFQSAERPTLRLVK